MIDKKQVQHIASLARLKLTAEEVTIYQKQLGAILEYVGQLQKVNTKNILPKAGGTQLKNILRNDEARNSSKKTREKLLKSAPLRNGDYIKTKAVFK